MRSRAFIVVVVVVVSWTLSGLLLAVDPLDAPFLADSDPDAVCAAAIHYQPPPPASAAAAQAATSPTILTDDTSYKPGQPLRVTVSTADGVRGLLLQGRRKSTGVVVGRFVDVESPGATTVHCERPDDTLVAWYADGAVDSTSFSWMPPDDAADGPPLQLVGTIFSDVTRYSTNVTSSPLTKGFTPIDVSKCGETKGCFRYTRQRGVEYCDALTCDYVLTYRVTGDMAHFEMSATAGWVAVGFSSDEFMGGEDAFVCRRSRDGNVAIRRYYNGVPGSAPSDRDDRYLLDKQWESTGDGRLSCRFSRQMKVDTGSSENDNRVDLDNFWYQLYAWGDVSSSGDTLSQHTLEKPPTSADKLLLRVKTMNVVVSGATSRICLDATRLTSVVLVVVVVLLLMMMLDPAGASVQF